MKKLLAVLLALCMVMSAAAFAEEAAPTYTYNLAIREFPTVWDPLRQQTATDSIITDYTGSALYGFDYNDVRAHKGIAWFPQVEQGRTGWVANPAYEPSELVVRRPRVYTEFGLVQGVPIYQQFVDNPDLFLFVSKPDTAKELWEGFEP